MRENSLKYEYLFSTSYLARNKKVMDILWFPLPLCSGVFPGFCAPGPTTTVTIIPCHTLGTPFRTDASVRKVWFS